MCVGGYRLTDFAHVKTHRGMTEESFLCLKSYGNTIVMNFFRHIFFSPTDPFIFGRTYQKYLWYDQISFYIILWKQESFRVLKLI